MGSEATDDSKLDAHVGLQLEKTSLENERLKLHLEGARANNKQLKDTGKLRKRYARRALRLAEVAIGAWLFFFALTGIINIIQGRPFLSDHALLAFTAGATVNVLAAFLGVVRGIFPEMANGNGAAPRK